MGRKKANRRGPSEGRSKVYHLPDTPSPERQPTASELEAIAARGAPLTDEEKHNRAEALRRATGNV